MCLRQNETRHSTKRLFGRICAEAWTLKVRPIKESRIATSELAQRKVRVRREHNDGLRTQVDRTGVGDLRSLVGR